MHLVHYKIHLIIFVLLRNNNLRYFFRFGGLSMREWHEDTQWKSVKCKEQWDKRKLHKPLAKGVPPPLVDASSSCVFQYFTCFPPRTLPRTDGTIVRTAAANRRCLIPTILEIAPHTANALEGVFAKQVINKFDGFTSTCRTPVEKREGITICVQVGAGTAVWLCCGGLVWCRRKGMRSLVYSIFTSTRRRAVRWGRCSIYKCLRHIPRCMRP